MLDSKHYGSLGQYWLSKLPEKLTVIPMEMSCRVLLVSKGPSTGQKDVGDISFPSKQLKKGYSLPLKGGITNSTDMNLGNLQEMVRDREAWHAAVYEDAKSRTRLGDWTTNNPLVKQCHPTQSHRPQHHSKMSMLFSQVSLADHTCMISALWPLGQTVCLTQCTSSQCNLQLRIWKQLAQHLW